ncbi:MAG TPA: hypothetical protein VM848_13940 [Acidimicrobiia bacterium]|nr:hypothetical protein [Acidimicrobiia bacterium]
MSRRPDSGARTRSRVLGWLAGAAIVTFVLATSASADISPISPESGTVEPKGSVTATFTVVDSVTGCFAAEVPPRFSVTFDGLGLGQAPTNCALEGTEITMTVTAGAKAQPGDYQVTIIETALGGRLLGTHEWPFTVPAPPATTTTVPATTTTTTPTTTTTNSPTTTSAGATTTTSTQSDTTTDPGSPTTTAGPTGTANPTSPSAARVTPADDEDEEEVLAAGVSDDNLPYDRYPDSLSDNAPEILSRTVLSDQLRTQISRAFPVTVADAVLSPVVIAEYLFRSLLESARGLLIPILIATLLGLWMVWRMREEIDDDELALSRQSMV